MGRLPRFGLRRLALLGALLVGAGCGGNSSSTGDAGEGGPTRVGITASDGSSVQLADFAGAPLVVNMWATWCAPCVKEMPAFDEVAAERGSAVHIIGVNVGDTAEDAAAFAADLGVSYPQYTDPDGILSTEFGVTQLPATAFVDADGTVIEVHQGSYTADELRSSIDDYFPTRGTQP